ncbi:hypothetical protein RHGRI_005202 [Rhododendron griersonianum]|uniref:Uncharacterized protein n=1 Tax=Rhododendron griersonianum TaxID=479676 RepID=A0AAV6LCE8_9ERIC|nr:hypothetical protein RHGRI_005202 [Rhododendron griersonianum]
MAGKGRGDAGIVRRALVGARRRRRWSEQSLEWNDEPTEAQGEAESPPAVADDLCSQAFLKKEDNPAAGTEENEWDRLLRVR